MGIPHLTSRLMFREGDITPILKGLDELRMMRIFDTCAKRGIGIELSGGCFGPAKENPDIIPWKENPDEWLRLYRMAKKAGCLFYCGSDAHARNQLEMNKIKKYLPEAVEILGITEKDRFKIKA